MIWLALALGCSEYEAYTDTREEMIDEYITVEGVRVDVLFVGDTSSSMMRELLDLSDHVSTFTSRLEESASDWQIAAVTGPTGCAVGGYITPETPDWGAAFGEAITTPPGEDSVDEWGLFNAFKAVLQSAPGGCNEGFLRPEAALHVIFLSDEADSSPGYQQGGDYWRDYVDPILYVKDQREKVHISTITGPVPSGCDGAQPGTGYVDAARYTGGEELSICDEWTGDLGLLADAGVVQDLFPLAHEPIDPAAIGVEVDGEPRLTGWQYDAAAQGVRFIEDAPGAWAEVHLSYRAIVEFEVTEEPA